MNLIATLAMAPAPTPPGTQPNPTGQLVQTVGMLAIMGVMLYFVLIRPQQKRARQQADLLKSIRPGDKVATNGGILGVVVTVKDKSVMLRSADAKMEIAKSAITEVIERSGESGES